MSLNQTSENDKYNYEPEEIKCANSDSLISKIRLGGKDFSITSPKDWSEGNPAHKAYIHGRTHYNSTNVSFTEQEVKRMYTEESHEYYSQSRYTFKNSADRWMPTVPWFSFSADKPKPYDLVVQENGIEYYNSWNLSGGSCVLENSKGTGSITVNFTAAEGFSINSMDTPTLIIRPVLGVGYDMLKQLDGIYIPVDNKTIRYNSTTGKIQTDALFDTDTITFSQDFGKFKANEEVDVSGLSLIDLFTEALCTVKAPEIEKNPNTIIEIGDAKSFESGEDVELDWKIKFNPGKYSYGTQSGNDSDLYISGINFKFMGEGFEFPKLIISPSGTERSLLSPGFYTLPCDAPAAGENTSDTEHTVAVGKFVAKASGKGTAKLIISVNYGRIEDDEAVNSAGKIPEPADKVSMNVPANLEQTRNLTSNLNWFWGCGEQEFQAINLETAEPVLGSLPKTITTNKAQHWYFAIPEGSLSSLELFNTRTGVPAGIMIKGTNGCEILDVNNATHKYDIYSISNAAPDKNTNTYEIRYTINTGGVAE